MLRPMSYGVALRRIWTSSWRGIVPSSNGASVPTTSSSWARDSQGPIGYAAARLITRAGLKVGMVVDCVTIDDGINAFPLFEAVISWLREQGASAAMGYFRRGSAAWRQARAAGFLRLPGPLVPRDYPVCASVRPEEPCQAALLDAIPLAHESCRQ